MKRALELEQIARESFMPEHRRDLFAIAKDWRELAAMAAREEERKRRAADRRASPKPLGLAPRAKAD